MPGRQGWYGHFGFDSSAIHVGIHVDVDLVMQVLQHSPLVCGTDSRTLSYESGGTQSTRRRIDGLINAGSEHRILWASLLEIYIINTHAQGFILLRGHNWISQPV